LPAKAACLTHRVVRFASKPAPTAFAPAYGISGKKNPRQLMDARDLKMHKPWW